MMTKMIVPVGRRPDGTHIVNKDSKPLLPNGKA